MFITAPGRRVWVSCATPIVPRSVDHKSGSKAGDGPCASPPLRLAPRNPRTRTFSNRCDNDESQGFDTRSATNNNSVNVPKIIADVVALIHKIIKKKRFYSNLISCQSFRRERVALLTFPTKLNARSY